MINILNIINTSIVAIGIPSIVGCFIYIGRKLQKLDDLVITVDKIKHNMNVICNFLIKNNDNFNSSELVALSPFQLTENGKKFIRDIGFDKIFDEYKDQFFSLIDEEKPRLKYDVEIAAIKAVSILSEKEFMEFLRIYFYNNPMRNLENTAPTLGVYIRDFYIGQHPEIKR